MRSVPPRGSGWVCWAMQGSQYNSPRSEHRSRIDAVLVALQTWCHPDVLCGMTLTRLSRTSYLSVPMAPGCTETNEDRLIVFTTRIGHPISPKMRNGISTTNVRTNRIHTVVSAKRNAGLVLNAFKANATRQLRADGPWVYAFSPWADKGSKRKLWNEQSVAKAIDYVLNGQGGDLPDFDS